MEEEEARFAGEASAEVPVTDQHEELPEEVAEAAAEGQDDARAAEAGVEGRDDAPPEAAAEEGHENAPAQNAAEEGHHDGGDGEAVNDAPNDAVGHQEANAASAAPPVHPKVEKSKKDKKEKKEKKAKDSKAHDAPTSASEKAIRKLEEKFGEGDIVVIWGLSSDAGKSLNGQRGQIMRLIKEKMRFEVRLVLEPDRIVNLKPENLSPLEDGPKKRPGTTKPKTETATASKDLVKRGLKREGDKELRGKEEKSKEASAKRRHAAPGGTAPKEQGEAAADSQPRSSSAPDKENFFQEFWGDNHEDATAYGDAAAQVKPPAARKTTEPPTQESSPARRQPEKQVELAKPVAVQSGTLVKPKVEPNDDEIPDKVASAIVDELLNAAPVGDASDEQWKQDSWGNWYAGDWKGYNHSWGGSSGSATQVAKEEEVAPGAPVQEEDESAKASLEQARENVAEVEKLIRSGPSSRWLTFCQEREVNAQRPVRDKSAELVQAFLDANAHGSIARWPDLTKLVAEPTVPLAKRRAVMRRCQLPALRLSSAWSCAGFPALARYFLETDDFKDIPRGPEVSSSLVRDLRRKFVHAVEQPAAVMQKHLQQRDARRMFVGAACSSASDSLEDFRTSCDFIVTSNTWLDVDHEARDIPTQLQERGCAWQSAASYTDMRKLAASGMKLIVQVSCVATDIEKLNGPSKWWKKLWQSKYSMLELHNVAFLWVLPSHFRRSPQNVARLEKLIAYLEGEESGSPDARHIIEFHDSSWYTQETYDLLHRNHWCLAWLHDEDSSADVDQAMPKTGWTDRIVTTDFCYVSLLGHSRTITSEMTKEIVESCPVGCDTYVCVASPGTGPMLDENAKFAFSAVALSKAALLRSGLQKEQWLERLLSIQSRGECPRLLDATEKLLVNYVFMRFSARARAEGMRLSTPVCIAPGEKYSEAASAEDRCFEWYLVEGERHGRLHVSISMLQAEEDLWLHLRQLSGFEDRDAVRAYAGKHSLLKLSKLDSSVLTRTFLRFSRKARKAGLHCATPIVAISQEGLFQWKFKDKPDLQMSPDDMREEEDIWRSLAHFTPGLEEPAALAAPLAPSAPLPWKSDSWNAKAGEMWNRNKPSQSEDEQQQEQEAEDGGDWHASAQDDRYGSGSQWQSWSNNGGWSSNSWKDQGSSWTNWNKRKWDGDQTSWQKNHW